MPRARKTQPPPKVAIAPAAHAEKSSSGGTAARGGAVGSAAPASSGRMAARAMARCATSSRSGSLRHRLVAMAAVARMSRCAVGRCVSSVACNVSGEEARKLGNLRQGYTLPTHYSLLTTTY